jgi:hypothetical protein
VVSRRGPGEIGQQPTRDSGKAGQHRGPGKGDEEEEQTETAKTEHLTNHVDRFDTIVE